MTYQGSQLDEQLVSWNELTSAKEYTGLLLGNGASLSVWDGFSYPSLYEVAQNENPINRFATADINLFDSLGTKNFEQVLSALAITRQVKSVLGENFDLISERYTSIQNALVEAVKSKHIPWSNVPGETLNALCKCFLEYQHIYSTNYDLLVYWAIMKDKDKFKDFLWGDRFNLADTELWGKATVIAYLHGGLHLYRTLLGETIKRQSNGFQTLLDLFGLPMEEEATPLFIAEGTSKDKLRSIYHSDYLTFAYTLLAHHQGPLCIFGHSLGDSDQHIIDAIKKAQIRDLAYSIRATTREEIISKKAALIQKMPEISVQFFDASTHPLGSLALKVITPVTA